MLKEVESKGGMTRSEMQKFAFDRRRNKALKQMSRGYWNTNISAMVQAKLIIKDGKLWKINPKIDINKLKITVPKWTSSMMWGGDDDKAYQSRLKKNVKEAKKQTSEAVADNMPEENTDELKKEIGKALASLKKIVPVMKDFADFTEKKGFSTGEAISEIRKYGSDPIAKKLLEKAIIAINEEA